MWATSHCLPPRNEIKNRVKWKLKTRKYTFQSLFVIDIERAVVHLSIPNNSEDVGTTLKPLSQWMDGAVSCSDLFYSRLLTSGWQAGVLLPLILIHATQCYLCMWITQHVSQLFKNQLHYLVYLQGVLCVITAWFGSNCFTLFYSLRTECIFD